MKKINSLLQNARFIETFFRLSKANVYFLSSLSNRFNLDASVVKNFGSGKFEPFSPGMTDLRVPKFNLYSYAIWSTILEITSLAYILQQSRAHGDSNLGLDNKEESVESIKFKTKPSIQTERGTMEMDQKEYISESDEKVYYSDQLTSIINSSKAESDKNEKLIELFFQLGDLYVKRASAEEALRSDEEKRDFYWNYADAAVFYNYVISMSERAQLKTTLKEDDRKFYNEAETTAHSKLQALFKIMAKNLSKKSEDEKLSDLYGENIKNIKSFFNNLRTQVRSEIKEIDDIKGAKEKIKKCQELFESIIAEQVRTFLAELWESCADIIGKPDFKYSVVGLGSLALKQFTPYSDLEFAVLLENSDDEKIIQTQREHIKRISHLMNFMVIGLGETIIPTSKYGIDLSNYVNVGFNFDLGGKTPLGRIDNDKDYDLIQPITTMIEYVKDEKDRYSHRDKCLPYILEVSDYIYGDKELHGKFRKKVEYFLFEDHEEKSSLFNCEARALKVLNEERFEYDYTQTPATRKTSAVKGNLKIYDPQLFETSGEIYDIKQAIYRLPDRLLYSLVQYYGHLPTSIWDGITYLEQNAIINSTAAANLKYAATFAVMLRSKAYLANEGQHEKLSIYPLEEQIKDESKKAEELTKVFCLNQKDLTPEGDLFKFYYTALPLHSILEVFCTIKKEERKGCLISIDFYEDTAYNNALIYHKLTQYNKVIKVLEQRKKEYPNDLSSRNLLGTAYFRLGMDKDAFTEFEFCVVESESSKIYKTDDFINYLINRGAALKNLGEYEKALEDYEKGLKMKKEISSDNNIVVANYLDNIGEILFLMDEYEKSLEYHKESLAMKRGIYGEKSCHSAIITTLMHIANVFYNRGKYNEALEKYKEILKIQYKLYEKDHYAITVTLNNIGNTFSDLGEYKKALENYEKSLAMKLRIYGEEADNLDIVVSLNNIASIYMKYLKDYNEAFKYFDKTLKMLNKIYEGKDHPKIAIILSNIAVIYKSNIFKQYEEAREYFSKALEMQRRIYGEEADHSDIAFSLNSLGEFFGCLGEYEKAFKYFDNALKMLERIYGEKADHPDIADCLNNIGVIFVNLNCYEEALKYHLRSLEMRREIYGKEADHPDIATSLNNVGNTLEHLGRYKEALKYHQQSLEMRRRVYKDKGDDASIADCLNNIGTTLGRLGEYKMALDSFQKSLEMRQRVYKGDNVSIADCLSNIGITFEKLGDYKMALDSFQKSLEMRQRVYKGDDASIAASLNNVGTMLGRLEDYKMALDFFEKSLEMRRKIYGKEANHPDIATSLNNVGATLKGLERYAEALKYHQESLNMMYKVYTAEHPNIALITKNIILLQNKLLRSIDIEPLIAFYENKILEEPSNRSNRHNLACYYHVKAMQIKQSIVEEKLEDDREVKDYLIKAKTMFEQAVDTDLEKAVTASLYTEYSMFLLCYHDVNNEKEFQNIANYLRLSIEFKEDGSGLSYGQMEKETVVEPMKQLLKERKEINVKPYVLAYYLLVKLYKMHGKSEDASAVLEEFQKAISDDEDKVTLYLFKTAQRELSTVAAEIPASWVYRISAEADEKSAGRSL